MLVPEPGSWSHPIHLPLQATNRNKRQRHHQQAAHLQPWFSVKDIATCAERYQTAGHGTVQALVQPVCCITVDEQ